MNKYKLIVIMVAVFHTHAFSEPSGLVFKLMNTEVSAFSYGLDRLNTHLSSIDKKYGYLHANYDWDTNRITISSLLLSKNNNTCKGDAECQAILKINIDSFLSQQCITSKGSKTECDLIDNISSKFGISGFSRKDFYDGKGSEVVADEIPKFIDIKASIFSEGKVHECIRGYIAKTTYCTTK